MSNTKPTLSLKVRIAVGILSLPSLFLAFVLATNVIKGNDIDISFFEVIYSLVGIFAMHIALSGKKYF